MSNRNSSNHALADAFYRTKEGATVVYQARNAIKQAEKEEQARQIAARIRQLKDLAFATFISKVPSTVTTPRAILRHIYEQSKPVIRKLGINGGAEYERALEILKYTWSSEAASRGAVSFITTPR